MLSITEENYIKVIYRLSERNAGNYIHTNDIAHEIQTKAASVTDMIKRLASKKLVNHKPYYGAKLNPSGVKVAKKLIRNHRLWEYFLVNKLDYKWDEVHDIAEQLEHIRSEDLIDRLESYLGSPKYDPHGDPIPDADGNMPQASQLRLADLSVGDECIVVGVRDHSPDFLNFLDMIELTLGSVIKLENIIEYDKSMKILLKKKEHVVSSQVSINIIVQPH